MKRVAHLIKMTFKVYKERGPRSTFFRILNYLEELLVFFYLLPILRDKIRKDILYVCGCPGGSRFYRCDNQAEEIKNYGLKSLTLSQDNIFLRFIVNNFKVFIFQRVIFNKNIEEFLNEIKRQGKVVFFETDDLVYDPNFSKNISGFNYFSKKEKKWYSDGIGREILEDSYIKNCIVSTHHLKKRIFKKYPEKNVFISTNKMGKSQLRWANKFYHKKDKYILKDDKIRIGYFSGSKSHDKDFKIVEDILLDLLEKNKNVVLMIVGFLKLSEKFNKFENQIERHSFVSYGQLPKLILREDINIAPLEKDNPFCKAKSALKYFESGILEIPTIATATDSFKRVIKNGETGFLAENGQEWECFLSELIKNKEKRLEMGKKARLDVLENYTIFKKDPDTEKLVEFMKEVSIEPLDMKY